MKKNITSSRSFGQDIDSLDQIGEAMFNYIKFGIKKLKQNKMSVRKVTIFISGNKHKGQGHYDSKTIGLTNATQNDVEIWSQIESHLNKMYSKSKQYKKCGILFQELIPENTNQMSLFSENIKLVQPPINRDKKWEMRQDFISNKFTTSWDELPIVFT